MFKKLFIFLLFVIFASLRLVNLSGRMPFAWDQVRDIKAVQTIIQFHHPTLIGPVVRGNGGFLLGPLYYYLLLPAQLFTHGSPLALAFISIIIFLSFLLGLYFLPKSTFMALALISLFGFSWHFIGFSQISWNAALILPYTLAVFWLYSHWSKLGFSRVLPLSAFLWGLAWQVHPSVFFLIPLVWLFKLRQVSWRSFIISFLALLFSLSPLILFDLRHQFLNFHLLIKFFSTSHSSLNLGFIIQPLLTKFFLTISFWLLGFPQLYLGLLIFILVFGSFWFHRRQSLAQFSWWLIVVNLLGLFFLHDPNFAEYYFLPSALAVFWLLVLWLDHLPNLLKISTLILFVVVNLTHYQFVTAPYSLRTKQAVVQTIVAKTRVADISLQLPLGRTFGFDYLFHHNGLIFKPRTKLKIIVTDNSAKLSLPPTARLLSVSPAFNYKVIFFVVE